MRNETQQYKAGSTQPTLCLCSYNNPGKTLMKSILFWICLTASILMLADIGRTHGVRGRIGSETSILVEAEYDDGEPVSYAAVEVLDPEEKIPFQTGRTDRNGRFLFLPDKPGEWKVVVNDEMGHRVALKTTIDKSINLTEKGDQTDTNGDHGFILKYEKALMGITIIFGICGFFFWWNGKKIRAECEG